MTKRILLKQVFAVIGVDEISEDDLGLEDIQPDDEIVGEFSAGLRELWVTKFLLEEELTKLKEACGGSNGKINFRKKICRRCSSLQIAIKDIEDVIAKLLKKDGFSGALQIKKGWKLVTALSVTKYIIIGFPLSLHS